MSVPGYEVDLYAACAEGCKALKRRRKEVLTHINVYDVRGNFDLTEEG